MNRATRRHPVTKAPAGDAIPIPPKTLEAIRLVQHQARQAINDELGAMLRALNVETADINIDAGTYTLQPNERTDS